MTQPRVIHFEILGDDQVALQKYWSELLGWKLDTSGAGGYGMTDPAETGVVVGIGDKRYQTGHVTAYVRVADIDATLAKAVKLGGKVIMPKFNAGPEAVLAVVADPEGHVVGLSE